MVASRGDVSYSSSMAGARRALVAAACPMAVVVPAACDDDNSRYGELESAAEELASAIAGTDVTVIAAPSPCPDPDSCPDIARVDLRDRTDLSLDQLATIATDLGWNATVVNERLITLVSDDEMSGSIGIDGERRVVVAVGED